MNPDFLKKKKEKKYEGKTIEDLKNMVKDMAPCPFCKTEMSIIVTNFGFQHYGLHEITCPMAGVGSSYYGSPLSVIEEWNKCKKK